MELETSPQKNPEHPNVVLILTDDQGWGDLRMNGHELLSTPNIDGLASSGVSFERFYVSPVCSPTRAEILTGRYHVRGGVYSTSAGGERLNLDETTMGDVFKSAGYKTAAYGKWHNGMQAGYHPNARGFDDFYGFCSGHWGNYFDPILEHNGEIVKGKGYITDDLTDRGISFIQENKDEPFFLYLPYCTPHSPMQVPDEWYKKYDDLFISQKGTIASKEKIEHTRAALAMVENIDWNVGRIMDELSSQKLLNNTIVIYLSDNGPNGHRWNGGMKGTKGSTDEGGLRSPLMMSWKGTFEAGKKIEKIATSIDLLPTLCDLVGIPLQTTKAIDGLSIEPLLTGDETNWTDRVITSYWRDRISLRSQTHRLDHEERLYDMINDPGQTHDISEDQPNIKDSLLAVKEQWKTEVLSELPSEDNRTFDIGHPDYVFTQIPARDGTPHGSIKRSNKYPNCSYMTNWVNKEDKITWEAKVLETGMFDVDLYYTCDSTSVGSSFIVSFGDEQIEAVLTESHNPLEFGKENDRFERVESYVKDFKRLNLGQISLEKGSGVLELKAKEIKGTELMDFRMLMLKRSS
jgi:arylsulfatase A-like enzyme